MNSPKQPVYSHSLGVCLLCNNLFSTDVESDLYPAWDNGYDGLVCQRCVRIKLRNRVKEYTRRARTHRTYSKLSRREVFMVIYQSDMKCTICGTVCDCSGTSSDNAKLLTIDHDYPLGLGGMNIAQNLVVMCEDCHRRKDHRRQPLLSGFLGLQDVKRGKDGQIAFEKRARKNRRRKQNKANKRYQEWMSHLNQTPTSNREWKITEE